MNENRNFAFDDLPYRPLFMLVFFLLASHVMGTSHYSILSYVYGHLVDVPGAQSGVMSKSIGNYVILFQTSPSPVQVSDNTTLLRFSVMQNNQDTYGVFAALIIKEKILEIFLHNILTSSMSLETLILDIPSKAQLIMK